MVYSFAQMPELRVDVMAQQENDTNWCVTNIINGTKQVALLCMYALSNGYEIC